MVLWMADISLPISTVQLVQGGLYLLPFHWKAMLALLLTLLTLHIVAQCKIPKRLVLTISLSFCFPLTTWPLGPFSANGTTQALNMYSTTWLLQLCTLPSICPTMLDRTWTLHSMQNPQQVMPTTISMLTMCRLNSFLRARSLSILQLTTPVELLQR